MLPTRTYYMLVASLPQLPRRFDEGVLPISRHQLRSRMSLLHPQDRLTLSRLSAFFVFDRQPLDRTDSEAMQRFHLLQLSVRNPLAIELIRHRMELRTLVSSWRKKISNEQPPDGEGPLIAAVRRGWNQPLFGLGGQYPWFAAFVQASSDGDLLAAQRCLFRVLWEKWSRLSVNYHFTFESILLYVAQWEIVERWTSQNIPLGEQRFEKLLSESMGQYASLTW